MTITIGRNDPCHCGSGKKYKKCHLEKDEAKARKEREIAALNAAKVMAEKAEKEKKEPGQPSKDAVGALLKPPPDSAKQGWMGKMASKVGFFQRFSQKRAPGAKRGG